MSSTKTDNTAKTINPFIQMIEDKKRVNRAVEAGKPLSTLKGIRFVKPI